jgi:hypothetical protein
MVERVCPECQHGNPLDNRFCGRCGAQLERQLPLRAPQHTTAQSNAITVAGYQLPVTWKRLGQTVALSLTALAAEAGMSWLRRKLEHVTLPQTAVAQSNKIIPQSNHQKSQNTVTITSHRVVELWEQGKLKQQIVDKHLWRKEE